MKMIWTNEGGDGDMDNPLNWRDGTDVTAPLTGAHRVPTSTDDVNDWVADPITAGTCAAGVSLGPDTHNHLTASNCTFNRGVDFYDFAGSWECILGPSVTIRGGCWFSSNLTLHTTALGPLVVEGNCLMQRVHADYVRIDGDLNFDGDTDGWLRYSEVNGNAEIHYAQEISNCIFNGGVGTHWGAIYSCTFNGPLALTLDMSWYDWRANTINDRLDVTYSGYESFNTLYSINSPALVEPAANPRVGPVCVGPIR